MADWIESIVKARFLVACLGETASPPWWRSEATKPVSRRMLERIYPRTYLAASLNTVSRAAALQHDTHIGLIGAYHLFRLPTADEISVQEFALSDGGTYLLRELATLNSREQFLAALSNLDGGTTVTGAQGGPTRCGAVEDLHSGRAAKRVCAAYLRGFSENAEVYPYLETENRS